MKTNKLLSVLYDKRINIRPRLGNVRENSFALVPLLDVSQTILMNHGQKAMKSMQDINTLMQLGDQLLHNIPTGNYGNNYNQNTFSTTNKNWRDTGYRNNRREEQRPYRRYNGNNHRNDRFNSNRQCNERRYERS
mgnify:CR=1 FL=1